MPKLFIRNPEYFDKDCTENLPRYKCFDISEDDFLKLCKRSNIQVDKKPEEETVIKPTALASDTGLNLIETTITNTITDNTSEYTNGGIFKKVFKLYGIDETKDNIVIVWLSEKDEHGIPISKEWWNAPFKGE